MLWFWGMDIRSQLKERFRNTTLRQLEALWLFANSKSIIVTSSEIGEATSTPVQEGQAGLISSLSKIKTEKGPLLLKAGRIPGEGTRWTLNQQVITRDELAEILKDIDPELG